MEIFRNIGIFLQNINAWIIVFLSVNVLGNNARITPRQEQTAYSDVPDEPSSDCHVPLGVANSGLIPLYWLQASDGFAYRGRLGRTSAWVSDRPLYSATSARDSRLHAWIQVDLRRPSLVTGVRTQGDPWDEAWVTRYTVHYSRDCESFSPAADTNRRPVEFHGNHDQSSVVDNLLPDPVVARCVRLVPLRRHGNHTALRMELLGCDVRMCREAVITHLQEEVTFSDVTSLSTIFAANASTPSNQNAGILTTPTLMKRGYAEFKFGAEQVVFGLVVYRGEAPAGDQSERFMLTYSRNCHSWEAVREAKWLGHPMIFRVKPSRYRTSWHTLPYPVRAQCVRVIPVNSGYQAHRPIQAHFIGCGTGVGKLVPLLKVTGASERCGVRRSVRARTKRVIGGRATAAGEWPWLVSLQLGETPGDFYHICGASLIHPRWLITALHCVHVMYSRLYNNTADTSENFTDPGFLSHVRAVVGKHSLTLSENTDIALDVAQIIGHPDFNRTYYVHDVAVIKLSRDVRLSDHVGLSCAVRDPDMFNSDSDCKIIGWGKTGPGKLPSRPRQVAVRLFDFQECQNIYTHLNLTSDMLCAGALDGTADACFGDSGGPLVCEAEGRWHQLGVVSWNIGCAYEGFPGVYASVPGHYDWVQGVLAGVGSG